jgi:ribosome-associated protein
MAEQSPSKTRRKQEMLELQELGVELVALDDGALDALELPDALRDAVVQARSITRFEARRRQLQYIGKLMRRVDPGPIRAVLDEQRARARAETAVFRRAESWRERLLNDPDSLAHFLAEHPSADASRLRALIDSARRERSEAGPPHSYKELFRALRELLGRYTPGP